MTICVCLAVNDGLVFAADSASTLMVDGRVSNVYPHGDKVFNLYKSLPIVAMTCGMGNIGNSSIATLTKEFRRRLCNVDGWKIDKENYSIADIADKARRFFYDEKYLKNGVNPKAYFEFWIGGFGSGFDAQQEVWKIIIQGDACAAPIQLSLNGDIGFYTGGQAEPIQRLVAGIDVRAIEVLKGMDVDEDIAVRVVLGLRDALFSRIFTVMMPLKDAIDLADYLVDTTKKYYRFLPGADIVGGDTDIAVVTRYEGFKWIKRKHFYPASLNLMETDHV